MPNGSRKALLIERCALPACLLAQACLLLARLDLLPTWGDEHFTLVAAAQSFTGLLETIATEKNNPPLHTLLVHVWLRAPWPAAAVTAARALSVLFLLATTLLLDRLWLRKLGRSSRLWFLLLWATSPCVLLYARIARSYSLQLLFFTVAVSAALGLLGDPRKARKVLWFAAASAALLYTHYLPGLAILGAVALVMGWRAVRERQPGTAFSALVSIVLVGVLFIPWLPNLWAALGRMAQMEARPGASLPWATDVIRFGYCFFSFGFGETPPLWVLAGSLLVAPGIAYLLCRGARRPPGWLVLVLLAAIAAYIGAGRWVSFAFVPARLFFVLPFFLLLLVRGVERSPRTGSIVCCAMVLLSAGSAISYFRKNDFLNKAYILPYGEIAATVDQASTGKKAVVIADVCNTDPWPLSARLPKGIRIIPVTRESKLEDLRRRVDNAGADTVWYFRNTHDVSPGSLNLRLESQLAEGRRVRTHFFVPYSQRDRLLMKLLGWTERPTHYVQLSEISGP
jgi:hypothetical protein